MWRSPPSTPLWISHSLTKSHIGAVSAAYARRNRWVFNPVLKCFQCQFWICNVFGQGVPHSRIRRHGNFFAQKRRVLVRGVVRCPRAAEHEGGLAPRFPKCRIDWDMSGHGFGVSFERRLQFWKWCVGGWEANEADPWAQAWCGRISLCSWSAWPPRWGRIATFAGQCFGAP